MKYYLVPEPAYGPDVDKTDESRSRRRSEWKKLLASFAERDRRRAGAVIKMLCVTDVLSLKKGFVHLAGAPAVNARVLVRQLAGRGRLGPEYLAFMRSLKRASTSLPEAIYRSALR